MDPMSCCCWPGYRVGNPVLEDITVESKYRTLQ